MCIRMQVPEGIYLSLKQEISRFINNKEILGLAGQLRLPCFTQLIKFIYKL